MTIAMIGVVYCAIVVGFTRFVYILRAQEYRLRKNQQGGRAISIKTDSKIAG